MEHEMIRNLTPDDYEEYYRVRLQSLEQYPVAYSSMPKFFVEASREMHMKLLADSASDSSFFVKGYFDHGKLLGIIGTLPESRECVDHKASMWGFYVDPNYQGKKIGAELLDAFLIDAKNDKNLKSIRLMVTETSQAALTLFYKVGFVKYGQERDSIRDDSRYYDQIYMQIDCSEPPQPS